MKLFDIIKNIFKVEKVEDINEELVEQYYNNMSKPEEPVENEETVKEEEKTEEIPETEVVVEEHPTEEEKTEEVVNEEPVQEEPVKEEEKTEDKKEEEVLTKEVINNAKGNIPMDKSDLMKLHGSEFFNALYKSRKNLM